MIRVVVVIYILILSQCGFCADSLGCIRGTVLDERSCEPAVGARVLIEGTNMGAMVNPFDGSYEITGIPFGDYTLMFSCIGYDPVTILNVQVQSNETIFFNIEMESQVYLIDSILVNYCPPWWYDKYEPRSIDKISSREIERIPAKDLKGILRNAGL